MPAFDIVCDVDRQEVRNAVDQTLRELGTRFDFRGVDSSVELTEAGILLAAEEEFQLGQMLDVLYDKLNRRSIDAKALEEGKIESAGKQKRQSFGLKQGIDRDNAKKIVKLVKDAKLKVQTQIQGEQLRVTGKKRDDLQQVMALLKEADLPIPLQFNNFRD